MTTVQWGATGDPSCAEIPRLQLDRLLKAVCYSH